ncbi:TIGR03084 family metal-binding protein [Micromonospora sp. NPDC003944]
MPEAQDVITDLVRDGDEVDRMLTSLTDEQWRLATPAPGWTVAHQVAHLAATFRMAATAAAEPDRFIAMMQQLSGGFDANVAGAMAPYLAAEPQELLALWRRERAAAEQALAAVPAGQPVPWLVRPLPAPVLAAAGMMELFGHGQDIADALGLRPERTDRIGHLVGFAVRTWDFGYLSRGLTPPEQEFRFELVAPSGQLWQFGPTDATDLVSGPAEDFCLLVTRRRHRDDLRVRATGEQAEYWLDIAQAYRGPAGPGRMPGQFATAAG